MGARARRAGPRRPRLHRRARHVADRRARASWQTRRGVAARGGQRRASASVIGRYFAMDRDKRWDRTAAGATTCSSTARAEHHADSAAPRRRATPTSATRPTSSSTPTTVGDEARIRPGDTVIAFNFRPDRMRQITAGARRRRRRAARVSATTLTEYEEGWPYPVAFPPRGPTTTLRTVVADAGGAPAARRRDREVPARDVLLRRRRGGARTQGERRELVPSPRDVPTYDHKPEMSAPRGGATRSSTPGTTDGRGFGIINFANADMVGHTGVIPAAVEAVETVDALPRRASSRRCRPRGGALRHHRRPRQRRPHARGRRLARTPRTRSTRCRSS